MARPPNADATVTRARILDAALELFADRGFYGTSMRQIGAAAGLTSSALYHHFPGKDDILQVLIAESLQTPPRQVLGALLNEPIPPLPTLVRGLLNQLLDVIEQPRHKKFWRLLITEGFRLVQEGKIPMDLLGNGQRRMLAGILATLMERGLIRRMDPEVAALELMGPVFLYRHFNAMWGIAHAAPSISRQAFVESHTEHLVRSFIPDPR